MASGSGCGTDMCVMGHGPAAGILNPGFDGGWDAYSSDHFGLTFADVTWDFLFNSCWSNDIQEAIARLDYVVTYGSPAAGWTYQSRYADNT